MKNLGKIGIVGGIGVSYNPFEQVVLSAKKAEEEAVKNAKKLECVGYDEHSFCYTSEEFESNIHAIEMEIEILKRSEIPYIEPKCKNQVWAKKGKNSRF